MRVRFSRTLVDDGHVRRGDRTQPGLHNRPHRCGLVGGYLPGCGTDAGLDCRLPGANLLPLGYAGPRPGHHLLAELFGGDHPTLVFGDVRQCSLHVACDLPALRPAVFASVLAPGAVPAGVEQHAIVAPDVAALLALWQSPADQPSHRVIDRTASAQLLAKTPAEPVGEHLTRVGTAREALHVQEGPSEEELVLVRLLHAGFKDQAIARQLGVSVRTATRRVAALMRTLDTGTRFQAGSERGSAAGSEPAGVARPSPPHASRP